MPSWFDLKTLDATGAEDDEGILKATDLVHGLIGDEVRVSFYMLKSMDKLKWKHFNVLFANKKIRF